MDYADMVKSARSVGAVAESRVRMAVKAGKTGAIADMISGGGGTGGLLGGKSNASLARTYGALKGWVAVCLNAIAKRVAGQAFGAGEITGGEEAEIEDKGGITMGGVKLTGSKWPDGRRPFNRKRRWELVKNRLPATIKQTLVVGGKEIESYLTHPVLDALATPNPVQKKWEFLYVTILNLYCTGESYWVGGKHKDGIEVWAVPTNWIEPKHDKGMFSSYELKVGNAAQGIPLKPEQVCRIYLPDPAEPKSSLSPVLQQISAIRTDQSIQTSQEEMFDRGIFPNIVITVGKERGPEGQSVDRRPILTGPQRRQILRAVRQVWNETVNRGDPAILDGLIESIHKLSNTPAEMDFERSGEIIKKRIFQAFGVNPYIVGDQLPGSRAQSAIAEQNFLDNTVNPLIDNISNAVQRFIGPMFDEGEKLAVWLEIAVANDEDLKQRRWDTSRRAGDNSENEYRTEILNLPPLEHPAAGMTGPLSLPTAMTQIVQVVSAVGTGAIAPDSAEAMMVYFGMEASDAKAIVGSTKPQAQPDPNAAPGAPPASGDATEKPTDGAENKIKPKPKPKPAADEPDEDAEDSPPVAEADAKDASAKDYIEDQHPRGPDGRWIDSDGMTPHHSVSSGGDDAIYGGIAKEITTQPPKGRLYNPKPDTTHARVGVPADEIPPPPPIGQLPNLTWHERIVEKDFLDSYEKDPDGKADDYIEIVKQKQAEKGGPMTFETDQAKELSPYWMNGTPEQRSEARATLNTALHQTANAIAKRAFERHLDTLKPGDKIMVTAGGCGAGKGFALNCIPEAKALKEQSQVVWDAAGDQNATENSWIQAEAEKRGLTVTYAFIHNDPKVSWADPKFGVVQRANDPSNGRMVDAHVFADSYAVGARNHAAFYEANKDNPNAKFVFIKNGKKPELVSEMPKEAFVDRDELYKFAVNTIIERADQIPDHIERGALIGKRIWGDK